MAPSLRMFDRAILAALFASALLVSGCSLGHTMKSVETVPKGEDVHTVGVAVSRPNIPSKTELILAGAFWNMRFGVTEKADWGFSLDGFWPGVGGKYRLLPWLAIDANVKLPVSEDRPGLIFDATAILGNARHSAGLKFLSRGLIPWGGGDDYLDVGKPDALLFYGYRFGFLMPEVFYAARHRGAGFGLGFLF